MVIFATIGLTYLLILILDKKTPFYSFHQKHKAKLVSFAGYTMPIQYDKGVSFEHNHVRNKAGVFDVSHMAQIMINGKSANKLVQKITTNDIDRLTDGKVQYSCMLNSKGGIIDDLLVYRLNQESFMLVVNAANTQKDFDWICSHNNLDVEVYNITSNKGLLAIQGPKAKDVLQKLTLLNLDDIPYYSFKIGCVASCPDVIVSNTGYTGSGGFELYFDKKYAEKIWKNLLFDPTLQPVGLAARDTLRLEMGYCLYGNDINENRSPIEAGLSWIVKINKDFIGKEVISQQLKTGVRDNLIGFELIDKGVPRKGYKILDDKDNLIGEVTSGSMSPYFKKGFGMGYVKREYAQCGRNIFIAVRNKKLIAQIIKMPLYEK